MRRILALLCLAVVAIGVAGCGASGTINAAANPQQGRAPVVPATATTTATATATLSLPAAVTTFTCPVTRDGSLNVFTDTMTGLSFSYPATWTENDCRRAVSADGTEGLQIGNLFSIGVAPRNGLTIQQWVSQQTDASEVVTLAPLTVQQADAAMTISASPAPNATSSRPFDAEPFARAIAVVAGSDRFYVVYTLVAVRNETDSTAGMSYTQLVQQIVSTFRVS